jgi:hypothetical protein
MQQQVIMPVNRSGPRPQEDHTLINTFTIEEIEVHIESLNTGIAMPAAKLKVKTQDILGNIMKHQVRGLGGSAAKQRRKRATRRSDAKERREGATRRSDAKERREEPGT